MYRALYLKFSTLKFILESTNDAHDQRKVSGDMFLQFTQNYKQSSNCHFIDQKGSKVSIFQNLVGYFADYVQFFSVLFARILKFFSFSLSFSNL
jgi:hypothetical protein